LNYRVVRCRARPGLLRLGSTKLMLEFVLVLVNCRVKFPSQPRNFIPPKLTLTCGLLFEGHDVRVLPEVLVCDPLAYRNTPSSLLPGVDCPRRLDQGLQLSFVVV